MTFRTTTQTLLALALGILASASSLAAIIPASVFSDNAVLQREIDDTVWGTAEPGEPITVSFNGQSVATKADNLGAWSLKLHAMKAGGPYGMTISGDKSEPVTLKNLYVGEVWFCTGQSNMFWPLRRLAVGQETASKSDDPELHLAIVDYAISKTPQANTRVRWSPATQGSTLDFSAVAYFFGRNLRKSLGVPVGLIEAAVGNTPIETWTSTDAYAADPSLRPLLDVLADYTARYPAMMDKYKADKADFDARVEAAKSSGAAVPTNRPFEPEPPDKMNRAAGLIYNGMISPVVRYGMRGVIWYQGENNAWHAYEYRKLFPTMIKDWRSHWGIGDFPFLYVQLPPLASAGVSWAELREAQREALSLPNTGMVVTTDCGGQKNLHPVRKEPVGNRLALLAEGIAYHQPVEYSGPVFKSMDVQGNKVRVTFTHADGLQAGEMRDEGDDAPVLASPSKLVGFEVAGDDKKYYPADAVIDGTAVVVSSDQVQAPVAVRYGWSAACIANLTNGAHLWASPFKTDSWPWVTQPK